MLFFFLQYDFTVPFYNCKLIPRFKLSLFNLQRSDPLQSTIQIASPNSVQVYYIYFLRALRMRLCRNHRCNNPAISLGYQPVHREDLGRGWYPRLTTSPFLSVKGLVPRTTRQSRRLSPVMFHVQCGCVRVLTSICREPTSLVVPERSRPILSELKFLSWDNIIMKTVCAKLKACLSNTTPVGLAG